MEYFSIEDINDFKELKGYIAEEKPKFTIKKYSTYCIYKDGKYNVKLSKEFAEQLVSNFNNKLIYGKDTTENIVSIEVDDDKIYLFYSDGQVETRPMIYWVLSPRAYDSKFERLEGSQHYKYIRKFGKKQNYLKFWARNKKRDLYRVSDFREAAMIYYGITLFKGMKPSDLSVLSFDIEGEGLNFSDKSKVFLITNTFRDNSGKIEKKHFRLDDYSDDDAAMIEDWCHWVVKKDPDVLNGHNIFGYDLPYLQYCYSARDNENENLEYLPLGKYEEPIKVAKYESNFRVDGNTAWSYNRVNIHGRHIVDGMFLAVKYDVGKDYPSWGLKQIAEHEGLVKENRQFYDASKIGTNWYIPEEREKIVAYGIDDSDDSLALYDLMIPSIFYMTNSVPKPFQTMTTSASGSQLNSIMVRAYLQQDHSVPCASEKEYVAGGMSYGVPGVYSNVVKFDAKSYYPSTILTFDIYDKVKDPEGYFLEMVRFFTEKRFEQKDLYKKTKEKKYDDLQAASKIFINSAYGLLGTPGLNFNSFKNAQYITKCCRSGLQKAILWATDSYIDYWWSEYAESTTATQDHDITDCDFKCKWSVDEMPRHNWKLVNIDTDAVSFCKQDESPFTEEEYNNAISELNKIMYSEWEDDGVFDRVLVVKAKNYVLKPRGQNKYKYKGSSLTDAKKEVALVELLHKLIEDLIENNGNSLNDIYTKYVKEAYNIEDINRWTTKKSITSKVLNPIRANEENILNAVKHLNPREGNKFWLYTALNGKIPEIKNKTTNPYCPLNKDLEPKMIDNAILKVADEWSNDEHKLHYVGRVYSTLEILKSVIDIKQFIKYKNVSNQPLLKQL